MYEVPPCEGLLRWVAPAQAQLPPEGTYLGKRVMWGTRWHGDRE